MDCWSDYGHYVDEYPTCGNAVVEGFSGGPVFLHNSEEGVHSDCANEDAAGQVSRRHEPSLSKTCWCAHQYRIVPQRANVEEEGCRLLDVGEEEIVYEDEELIYRLLHSRFQSP